MPQTCSDYPYNKLDVSSFNEYIANNDFSNNIISNTYKDSNNNIIDFSFWKTCITKQKDISHVDLNLASINTLLDTYNIDEQIRTDTANESNNYSMTLFQNDIYYTYGKIIFFIILIGSYIYFFRITGILEPIMKLFNFVKTKVMVDLPKTADKILAKKIPKQKTNAIPNPKPANANSAKTNSMK